MEAPTNTPTHSQDTRSDHDSGREHDDQRLIVLLVNAEPIRFRPGTITGLAIKQTAMAQGVAISIEFLLTVVHPNGEAQEIGDEDPVQICEGLEFVAIPDDDNSWRTDQAGVDHAVESLRSAYGDEAVSILCRDTNGAWVRIDDVPLGPNFAQQSTFVLAHLAETLPFADIYPIFVCPDLSRVDGQPLAPPVTYGHTAGPPDALVTVAQLSRRTRGDASQQTAAGKVTKVLNWLRGQS
jgi:Multiubiquitin